MTVVETFRLKLIARWRRATFILVPHRQDSASIPFATELLILHPMLGLQPDLSEHIREEDAEEIRRKVIRKLYLGSSCRVAPGLLPHTREGGNYLLRSTRAGYRYLG